MEELKGYVEHIIYRNEENTYTVFEVQCEEGPVTCTGFPPAISEGESCVVSGEKVQHAVYGEQFKVTYDKVFNVVPYITSTIVLFAAWVVGNWSVCTLLDGEGTMRNICVYSAYALVPYIAQTFICVVLSRGFPSCIPGIIL